MRHLPRALAALACCAVLTALAAPARASGGGEGGVEFGNLGQTLAAVLVFLVLFLILRKFAWRPILEQLRQRETAIAESLTSAEQRERAAQAMLAEYQAKMEKIEEEARQVLARSRQDGLAAKEEFLAEAREEARKLSEEQRRDIERAKQDALRQLYETTAQLAADMAGAVLARRLSPEDQRRIIAQSMADFARRGEDN